MSSLKAVYLSFLSKPTGAVLNVEASLNYISTLTTINSSAAIVKHFAAFERVLKKKGEKVLDAIESGNALCLEVDTTIEFLTGGGAYLPGLEENFLADRILTFPIVREPSIVGLHRPADGVHTVGSYRALRCEPKDSDNPPSLGSRITSQAS